MVMSLVDEAQPGVAGERPRQQVGLAEDLEAVADAEHRQPPRRRRDDLAHHRREPGDGAAAQVVAVGEAAGQDDGIDTAQAGVVVPELDRLAPAALHGAAGITSSREPGKVTTPMRAVMGVLSERRMLADYRGQPASLSCAADRSCQQARRCATRFASAARRQCRAWLAAQGHVVDAGPHDRQAAARLGQLGNRRAPWPACGTCRSGCAATTAIPALSTSAPADDGAAGRTGRTEWRIPRRRCPTLARSKPRPLSRTSSRQRCRPTGPPARSGGPGAACLSTLVQASVTARSRSSMQLRRCPAGEGVAEYPPHDRHAQRFPGEHQAELNVYGWLPRMEHPRSHPLLSPVAVTPSSYSEGFPR